MAEIPNQRDIEWLEAEYDEAWRIQKIDPAEAGEQSKADEIYEALRIRFAKAWWDGYHQGVEDSYSDDPEAVARPVNPWENP